MNIEMDVIGLGRLGPAPQRHRQHQRALRSSSSATTDTYNSDVKLGAYLDITDGHAEGPTPPSLQDHAPRRLLGRLPRERHASTAVPTYKDSSMSHYFVWDKDLLDANGIDASQACDTLESLTRHRWPR